MCFTDLVDYFYINFIFSLMSWFGGLLPVTPDWVVTNSEELVQIKHFLFYLRGVRLYEKAVLCVVLLPYWYSKKWFLAFYIFLPLVEP